MAEIVNALDLSTAHLREDTRERLSMRNARGVAPFRSEPHEYGFILFVDGAGVIYEAEQFEHFPELLPILQYAQQHQCFFVNFDQDAEQSDLFETFE